MSTYTIELSEYQGTAGSSNGEWTNQFKSKIVLEDGDILQIKQALINSQSTSVESINITEDTVARITFGFYDNPVSGQTADVKMLPAGMQDGTKGDDPYDYRVEVFANTVVGYVESKAIATGKNASSYNTPYVAVGWIDNKYQRITVDIDITIPKGLYDPNQIGDIVSKAMQEGDSTRLFNYALAKATVTPIAGTTQAFEFFCLASHYANIKDKTQLVGTDNQYIYQMDNVTLGSDILNYVAGAPSPAFEYQNERFQFSYLHTPLLLNSDGASDTPPYTTIGASNYSIDGAVDTPYFFSRYSGLYITDLTVQSGVNDFWEILGFTQTTFTDDNCSNLTDFTTDCFINSGAYENKSYALPVVTFATGDVWNYFIDSTDSTIVQAEENYQYDESGYYLINVISSFNNNYITQDSTLSKVACIASKQYQAGDYITAYSDSAIVYQHSGSPLILTNFQVQIIEPKTKAIASDLGANSSIFLQVIKAQPQLQQKAIKAK